MSDAPVRRAPAREMLAIGLLTAAQGIAPGFTSFALPVVLRAEGLSLQAVGLAGALFWPWAVKFVWGPLFDRPRAVAHARAWIVALQLVLFALLVALALLGGVTGRLGAFIVLVGTMNLCASILDVVTDGHVVRLLRASQRTRGSGVQLAAYYLGSILAGGVFLAVQARIGWGAAMFALALIVALGILAVAALPPRGAAPSQPAHPADMALPAFPARVTPAPPRGYRAIADFFRQPRILPLLAAIVLLDFAQNAAIGLTGPLLHDLGFSVAEVGALSSTGGLLAALTGALVSGMLLARVRRERALQALCAAQALALLPLALLAFGILGPQMTTAAIAVCIAYALASSFNVVLYAWFMDRTRPAQAATDFSLLGCVHSATYVFAEPLGGWSAGAIGLGPHFVAAALSALLCLAVARRWLGSAAFGALHERSPTA